jgi:hypothetical protein
MIVVNYFYLAVKTWRLCRWEHSSSDIYIYIYIYIYVCVCVCGCLCVCVCHFAYGTVKCCLLVASKENVTYVR